MSDSKREILETKEKMQAPGQQPSVLSTDFLGAITPDLINKLDEAQLKRFKSVLDAARELSESTYTGTAPSAHERT